MIMKYLEQGQSLSPSPVGSNSPMSATHAESEHQAPLASEPLSTKKQLTELEQ